MDLVHQTKLGQLFSADCLELLRSIETGSVHTFFADPRFNLGKKYGRNGSDDLTEARYLEWSKQWLEEGARVPIRNREEGTTTPRWRTSVGVVGMLKRKG
jgi:DNA modification methylase